MKNYLIALTLVSATASFAAGQMTVDEVVDSLTVKFFATAIADIRVILEEAKASEDAFKVENGAAKTEFEQLKTSGKSKEELLAFANARQDAAQKQVHLYQSIIGRYQEKAVNGDALSMHIPHMGLNGSPQIYEDWIVEVENLSKYMELADTETTHKL